MSKRAGSSGLLSFQGAIHQPYAGWMTNIIISIEPFGCHHEFGAENSCHGASQAQGVSGSQGARQARQARLKVDWYDVTSIARKALKHIGDVQPSNVIETS